MSYFDLKKHPNKAKSNVKILKKTKTFCNPDKKTTRGKPDGGQITQGPFAAKDRSFLLMLQEGVNEPAHGPSGAELLVVDSPVAIESNGACGMHQLREQ